MSWILWKAFSVLFPIVPSKLILQKWQRFNILSDGIFSVHSPPVPCMLSSVNIKPTGVTKLFRDQPDLTREHVNNIPSRPLTSIPGNALTRNITNSVEGNTDFRDFFFSFLFSCAFFFLATGPKTTAAGVSSLSVSLSFVMSCSCTLDSAAGSVVLEVAIEVPSSD